MISALKRLALATSCVAAIGLTAACGSNPAPTLAPVAPPAAQSTKTSCGAKTLMVIDTTSAGTYVQGTSSGRATCVPAGNTLWVLFRQNGVIKKVGDGKLKLSSDGRFSIPDSTIPSTKPPTSASLEFWQADSRASATLTKLPVSFSTNRMPSQGVTQISGIKSF